MEMGQGLAACGHVPAQVRQIVGVPVITERRWASGLASRQPRNQTTAPRRLPDSGSLLHRDSQRRKRFCFCSKPPRKQLSDQIDRLDAILDALSDGLHDAVADAAREGTRLAVKDAIVEILTDPGLRARLHQASAPEPAPSAKQPGFWARLKGMACQAVAKAGRLISNAATETARTVRAAATVAAAGVRAVASLGSLKKLALVGLGVGAAVGVASFLAPHAAAAVVSGIGSAVVASAVQVSVWTRRTVRALNLV
jgi:hypothetical protein